MEVTKHILSSSKAQFLRLKLTEILLWVASGDTGEGKVLQEDVSTHL